MVQVPILSGIYGKEDGGLSRSLPINLTPVAEPNDGSGTGISKGHLQTLPGIATVMQTTGRDRGAYVYNGRHLRVFEGTLYQVTDRLMPLGTMAFDSRPVQFAEGFGRLGIVSGGNLYYLTDNTLTHVTDEDLGKALSLAWSDGYFLTTDGDYIVATDLNDPTSVDPLKYGSSEADPDPIVGMLALRGEVYALNRYSIEKFLNQPSASGGAFPFVRSRGSQIPKGCVGVGAYTPFVETFAFCGSARNETAAIYLAGAGQAIRISPRALDGALTGLSDVDIASVELETLNGGGLLQLLVHLPNATWVYHWTPSQLLDLPVWSILKGGAAVDQPWPARHYQMVGTDWFCGGDGALGRVSDDTTLFGEPFGYRFDTPLLYNESNGAIVNEAELVKRGTPELAMSYTNDGAAWSQERFCGGRRLAWRRLGRLSNYRGYRFRGITSGPASFSRLEMQIEPLNG